MASHVPESDLSGVSDSDEERQDSWDIENERRMAGPPWEVHRSVESGKFWWSHPVSGPTATRPPMCEQYTPLPKPGAAGRWTVVDPGCNPFRGGTAKTQALVYDSASEEEEQDTRDTDGEVHVPESDEENDRPDNPTTRYIDAVVSNYRVDDMRAGLGTTRRKRLEKAKQICMGQMRRCRAEGDVHEETPFAMELGVVYALIEALENPPGALVQAESEAEPEVELEAPKAASSRKRKQADTSAGGASKRSALGYGGGGNRRRPPAAHRGGGALPFIVGSSRAIAANVNAMRPTPTGLQVPVNGLVRYRTNAVVTRTIGDRECVLEAISFVFGSNRITRASVGLPLTGDLNMKNVARVMRSSGTPFRLVKSPPVPWSGLLTKPEGIYIGRSRLKNGDVHYMGYDAWRHIIFIGGPAAPPAIDDVEQHLYYDGQRPQDQTNIGRCWFVEEDELKDPSKFHAYMVKTVNVEGGIDNLYRVDVIAKHARKTAYNTPEDYD